MSDYRDFRLLVETCPAGMLVVDRDERVVLANAAAYSLLGRERGQLVGEPIGIPLSPQEPRELEVTGADGATTTVEVNPRRIDWNDDPAWLVTVFDAPRRGTGKTPSTDPDLRSGQLPPRNSGLTASGERRILATIDRQEAVLEALNAILRGPFEAEAVTELAELCLEEARRLTKSRFGFIAEVNGNGTVDTIAMTEGGWEACSIPRPEARKMLEGISPRGIWSEVVKGGGPVLTNDPKSHPGSAGTPEGHPEIRSFLAVPVGLGELGQGIVGLANRESGYCNQQLDAMKAISPAIAQAISRFRADATLTESERRFRDLTESTSDWVWEVDTNARYTYSSPKVRDLLGYDPAEVLGKTPFDLMPEAEARRVESQFLEVVASRKPFNGLENTNVHRDGRIVVLETSGVPVFDANGEFKGYRGIDRNITVRNESERALAEQTRALERSHGELQQFAYVASHDLREPLRTISSFLGLLEDEYGSKLGEEASEFIGFVVDAAQRMHDLIGDLLKYSRVSTQGQPMEPTSLDEVLQETVRNLATAIEESAAEVTHDPLPVVTADRSQVLLLFQNLLSNAIKFAGDDPPRVHVTASRDGEDWNISVADNGIGIDGHQFGRILGVFQRLHTREEYPGTGIGLAICKRIVERHGGSLKVESDVGKGSTFSFVLQPDR